MTTRKKVTDQAKPPAKRSSRKKANPELEGGLFSDGKQIESPEPEIGLPVQKPEVVVATTPSPTPARAEVTGPTSHPIPSTPMTPGSEQTGANVHSWLMVTNQLNLLYMLAAGMAMGPTGFRGKHYRDPSSDLSGLIPVFRDSVPEQAIHQAISEQKHLCPCIVELDLSGVAGPTLLVGREGEVSAGALPSSIGQDDIGALLLRAPLPLTLVKRVMFRSAADRKKFESSARDVGNIDLSDLSIDVSEHIFGSTLPMLWPIPNLPDDSTQNFVDRPPARGEAIGGVYAMLYHLANRSEICGSVYRMVSVDGEREMGERDAVLAGLVPWIETGAIHPDSPVQSQLFWGAVQSLVDARRHGESEKAVDTVLSYLDEQLAHLKDATIRSRLERLISDMRATFGLGGGTISQLFERHKGTLSRPLLLLCLRERCLDLLEFSHPDLSDEELVLAGVLFGVREGWIGLPAELRTNQGLARFIEHRMFVAESSDRHERLSVIPVPPRPIPLRELLAEANDTRSNARNASLARVASKLGWDDCVVSRIRLPTGRYRLNVTADGFEVVVRGGISPPIVEIDKDALLKRVAQWPPLPPAIENEVRAELEPKG